jgi:hypothetical protein
VRRLSHPAWIFQAPGFQSEAGRRCSLRPETRFGFENAGSPRFRSAPWKLRPEENGDETHGRRGTPRAHTLRVRERPQTKKPPSRTMGPAARQRLLQSAFQLPPSPWIPGVACSGTPCRSRGKPRNTGRYAKRNGGKGKRSLRINITCLKALVQRPQSAQRGLEPLRHGTPAEALRSRPAGRSNARFRELPCHTFSSF